MKRTLASVCLALGLTSAGFVWAAEDRVVVVWSCELKDGATIEQVRELGRRLMAYVRKYDPDYRGYAMSTIFGDRTRIQLVDSYAGVDAWEMTRKEFQKQLTPSTSSS